MLKTLVTLVLIAALIAISANVTAGVLREDKTDSEWEFLLSPYLWAQAMKGTSQVGVLPPLDLDASFGDILSNANMAMAVHFEAHRGRWALVLDPFYASLEMDIESPEGQGGPNVEVDIWMVEFWTAYKFSPNWEVLGGGRWQSQDLDVEVGLPVPPFPDSGFGVKDDWLDWFVGARLNYPLGGSRWFVTGRADVTFAGDSDSGFNLSLMANRRIRKTMALNIGYRYFENDYDNFPKYAWDMRQQGPVFGYTWSF